MTFQRYEALGGGRGLLSNLVVGLFLLLADLSGGVAHGDDHVSHQSAVRWKSDQVNFQSSVKGSWIRGFGSGLSLLGTNSQGELVFLAVTDRGPQIDGPEVSFKVKRGSQKKGGLKTTGSKIFVDPNYAPRLVLFKVAPDPGASGAPRATLLSEVPLLISPQVAASGLPPAEIKGFNQYALGVDLKEVGNSRYGIDPEGVSVIDGEIDEEGWRGTAWLVEEYWPSLLKVEFDIKRDRDLSRADRAMVVKSFRPGEGLPKDLELRRANRGLESVTLAESGEVWLALQSPVEESKAGPSGGDAIWLVKLDPSVSESRSYLVKLPPFCRKKPADCKLGALATAPSGEVWGLFNFNKEAYLVTFKIDGAEPVEHLSRADKLEKLVKVETVMRMGDYGWQHSKSEGLEIVEASGGRLRFFIINDDDFQIRGEIRVPVKAIKISPGKGVKAKIGEKHLSKVTVVSDPDESIELLVLEPPH